jgi:hypothetical protein
MPEQQTASMGKLSQILSLLKQAFKGINPKTCGARVIF